MAAAGLFSMCAPALFGGAEADPMTTIATIEVISAADGATGWVLMIGAETTGICPAYLPTDTAVAMFANHPGVVICGALNPVGRARPVDGGFMVTGRWPFASGSPRADWFWGQCLVEDGYRGEAIEAVMPKSDYEVVETWNSTGLRGTGSHDVTVTDLFVPESHVTRTRTGPPVVQNALFRQPLTSRLAYNKVGVATGVARAAIDHFVELANERTPRLTKALMRERPRVQHAVAEAEALLGGARGFVAETIGGMWQSVQAGDAVTVRQQALVRLACSHAVQSCADAVTLLYSAAGAAMSDGDHPLARCFRDIHVVGQHLMATPHAIDDAGRVLLGLDPISGSF